MKNWELYKKFETMHRVCTQPKPKYFGVIATGNHFILIRCAEHHPADQVR